MANPSTVGEDFTVNGVSLSTYAYNIQTLAGREQTPPIVGDNIRVPYRNGRIWKQKTFDQRTIVLAMYVRGCDVNGVVPATRTLERATFNSNLRMLKRLFAPRGSQLIVTRTLQFLTGTETHTGLADAYNPSSGGFTAGGGGLGTNQWDLVPVSITYGTFSIDLVFADPWWYGASVAPVITSAGGTINNIGDVEHDHPVIRFNGPLTNPMLTNLTPNPDVAVWYSGTIASGAYVQLDANAYTAVTNTGASVIGNVFHTGALKWMVLEPGNNSMTLTNQAGGAVGSGNATVTYAPPYT